MTADPTDLLRRIVAAWDLPLSHPDNSLHPLITEARDLLAQPVPVGIDALALLIHDVSDPGELDDAHCQCRADAPTVLQRHPWLAAPVGTDTLDAAWARVEAEPVLFEYAGEVYVRPVSRGIRLEDSPDRLYIDDVVGEGYYRMEVRITALADALEARK